MKIGIFGCGNMGSALILGMKNYFPDAEFFLFTPSKLKARDLAVAVQGTCVELCSDMPLDLDWYLLAFKPQSLEEFYFNFPFNAKIISILAGTKIEKLIAKFHTKKIARLMPNTPSAIGLGANLLYLNSHFNQIERDEINSLLSATGKIFAMQTEEDLDLSTAFSGSGPALIFELARIFEEELTRMTEGRVASKEIVSQTFFGSTSLMNSPKNKDTSFSELKAQVTSKKGVTFEALVVMKNKNIQEIFSSAFEAAYKRTVELSK